MQTSISNRCTLAAQAAAFVGAIKLSDLPRPRLCVAMCAQCAERPALVPLADEQGNAIAGGLCRECVPVQTPEDPGLAEEYTFRLRYKPASLELVEQLANEADIARGYSVFTPAELDAVDEHAANHPTLEGWMVSESDLDRWLAAA